MQRIPKWTEKPVREPFEKPESCKLIREISHRQARLFGHVSRRNAL